MLIILKHILMYLWSNIVCGAHCVCVCLTIQPKRKKNNSRKHSTFLSIYFHGKFVRLRNWSSNSSSIAVAQIWLNILIELLIKINKFISKIIETFVCIKCLCCSTALKSERNIYYFGTIKHIVKWCGYRDLVIFKQSSNFPLSDIFVTERKIKNMNLWQNKINNKLSDKCHLDETVGNIGWPNTHEAHEVNWNCHFDIFICLMYWMWYGIEMIHWALQLLVAILRYHISPV